MSEYKINGVTLDSPQMGWVLEQATKLPAAASRRVVSLDLPYVDGVKTVRQGVGVGTVGVSVAVLGDTQREADQRHGVLKRLLLDASTVSYRPDGGTERVVSVVDCVLAEPVGKGDTALVQGAVFTVQPFWREGTPLESAAQALSGSVVFSEFAGCTGVLQDAVVRLSGPFGECTLTSPVDGSGIVFPGAVSNGSFAFVRLSDGKAWTSPFSNVWDGKAGSGYVADWPGPGPLRLTPSLGVDGSATRVELNVSATNTTNTSRILIRSSRWFL